MRSPTLTPLAPGRFYHIYNRSNGKERLFYQEDNYQYFLRRYVEYLFPFLRTYAYCLLANHFHLLVGVRETIVIRDFLLQGDALARTRSQQRWLDGGASEEHLGQLLSHQFSRFFNAYSKALNKQLKRSGNLFHRPFKRLEVVDEDYRKYLVYYIHANPQRHGWISDFTTYYRSSYHAILGMEPSFLEKETVLRWYGGREGYIGYHDQPPPMHWSKVEFLED